MKVLLVLFAIIAAVFAVPYGYNPYGGYGHGYRNPYGGFGGGFGGGFSGSSASANGKCKNIEIHRPLIF
jgi:hypothetical protein